METEDGTVMVTRWQRQAVALLAPRDERRGILEDLEEEAREIAFARGARAARRWIRWQIAHSAWPWAARRLGERQARIGRSVAGAHRGLATDGRIAVRRLVQARGFSVLAIVTLAIGITAVSAVFSLAYALWIKPLPFHEPERLVWIQAKHGPSGVLGSLTAGELDGFRRGLRTLPEVAWFMYGAGIGRINDERVRIVSYRVSPDLFRVLGVSPILGRDFRPEDTRAGARTVMLSHAAWERWFGRDPAVLGRRLSMTGNDYEISGVMPRGFTFPRGLTAEVWVPADLTDMPGRHYQAVARLAPAATEDAASAELAARGRHLQPSADGHWTWLARAAGETASPQQRLAFQALLGTVGLFLLIGCTNLAALLLARHTARRAELAICLSLGASRWRVARLLFVESLLLAAAGGLVGVLGASFLSRGLRLLMPARTPGLEGVELNAPVIALAIACALLSSIVITALPAWRLRTMRPSEALAGSRTVIGGQGGAQRVLVVIEIALALLLVVGAAVMLRAFIGQLSKDRGYDPSGLIALNVSLPFAEASYRSPAARAVVFDDMLARVGAVPGVLAVAATTGFPGSSLGILGSAALTPKPEGREVLAGLHSTSVDYFSTMRIPILAGRAFAPADSTGAQKVAMVNELLARQFPGADPIGRRIPVSMGGGGAPELYEIVGIAGNIRLSEHVGHGVFLPMAQVSAYWIDLVIRTDGSTFSMPAVRETLRRRYPNLLIENVSSFQTIITNSLALERAQSALAGLIGLLSTVVAAAGLYSLMTFVIASRRRELGIRLALGSPPARLFRELLTDALRLTVAGLVVGIAAAALVIRALQAQMFGLGSADVTAYASAAALLLLVSVTAAWIPARRVMRTDPLSALRTD
jgi:putative ABC transport system permease protein